MFLKSFLALAALLALVQFSVALHAEKPGVSLRRSTPPLARRSLGKPISKVKHTNPAVPAVRRNLVAEARALEAREGEGQCEDDNDGYCEESGECCPMDTGCCDDGNCAKEKETCCEDGGLCGEGEQCCNDGCIDEDEVCCDDFSCSKGEKCCDNGGCAPDDGQCCRSGGYCEEGTHCIIWKEEDEDDKSVCCKDKECSEEYDGDVEDLPTPKGSANRIGSLAGLLAVPVAAAAWL